VPLLQKFREGWVRPALFFGNNPISLAGGAITSASGVTMIGYWLVRSSAGPMTTPTSASSSSCFCPALFIAGLVLIPVGVFLRHRKLQKAGPDSRRVSQDRSQRPHLSPRPGHRAGGHHRQPAGGGHGQLSRRGLHGFAAVLRPVLPCDASGVHGLQNLRALACGLRGLPHRQSGAQKPTFSAKVNGTKQLIEVSPVGSSLFPHSHSLAGQNLRPARFICEGCHTPARFVGEKLLVKSNFADDEKNTETQTVLVLHLGGDGLALPPERHSRRSPEHMEYIATDPTRTTIPWVQRRELRWLGDCVYFLSRQARRSAGRTTADGLHRLPQPRGTHLCDRGRCAQPGHGRRLHQSRSALGSQGRPELLNATYASEAEASTKIPAQLVAFYRTQHPEVLPAKAALVKSAGDQLATLYRQNVFPDMK
jgi:hypothetical protein